MHYTEILIKQLIHYRFLKSEFSKSSHSNQQNDKRLVQKHKKTFGIGLSQTGQRKFFLIIVVKDNFS